MFKLRDNRKIERTKISGLTIIGLIIAIILFLPPLGWLGELIYLKIHPGGIVTIEDEIPYGYIHAIIVRMTRIWYLFNEIYTPFCLLFPTLQRIIGSSLLIISIFTIYINILGIREIRKMAHIKGRKLSIIFSIIGIIIAGVDTIFYIYYVIFVPEWCVGFEFG